MNDDDPDDIIPPPTPGGPGGPPAISGNHKDGDIIRPLPDGKMPEAPEGFTVVTKDNGLFVLRKRRYRDLKKVGIGGFQAKTRTPSRKPKDEPEGEIGPNGEKPKKRPAWRPKKNKLLVQYPEYIQHAFFGQDVMEGLDPTKNPEDFLEETSIDPKAASQIHGGAKPKLKLSKDILAALEEVKKVEEKERQEKEEAEAKLREKLAAEAAEKVIYLLKNNI